MKYKNQLASFLLVVFFLLTVTVGYARETIVLNTYWAEPVLVDFIQSMMSEAFNKLDIDVRVRSMPAERALKDSNSDHGADGETLRTEYISNKYPNLLKVPEQIFTLNLVAYSVDKDFQTNNWESLRPYHVAHIKGMKAIENKFLFVKPKSIQQIENARLLFIHLVKKRTDVAVWGLIEGLIVIDKLGRENNELSRETGGIRVLKPPLKTIPLYLYLNKRHKGLILKIDHSLKDMKINGSYQKIYERTIGQILPWHGSGQVRP